MSDLGPYEARHMVDEEWENFISSGAEDRHWVWEDKTNFIENAENSFFHEARYLHSEDTLIAEAAVWYRLDAKSMLRKDEDAGAVYIEMLAVAPWNRRSARKRKYRGVGKLTVQYVVWRSQNLGFGGRVILAALPDSERFYEALGFEKVGVGEEDLVQYELPEDAAKQLLEGFNYE